VRVAKIQQSEKENRLKALINKLPMPNKSNYSPSCKNIR
jgi:hypothetical protein